MATAIKISGDTIRLPYTSYTVFGSGGYSVSVTCDGGAVRDTDTEEDDGHNGFCGDVSAEFVIPPGGSVRVYRRDAIGQRGRILQDTTYYRDCVDSCGPLDVTYPPASVRDLVRRYSTCYTVLAEALARFRFATHPWVIAAIELGGFLDVTWISPRVIIPRHKELMFLRRIGKYTQKITCHPVIFTSIRDAVFFNLL